MKEIHLKNSFLLFLTKYLVLKYKIYVLLFRTFFDYDKIRDRINTYFFFC